MNSLLRTSLVAILCIFALIANAQNTPLNNVQLGGTNVIKPGATLLSSTGSIIDLRLGSVLLSSTVGGGVVVTATSSVQSLTLTPTTAGGTTSLLLAGSNGILAITATNSLQNAGTLVLTATTTAGTTQLILSGSLVSTGSSGGGGATTFLGLIDTPSSYSGQAGKVVVVNAGATALDFSTITGPFDIQVAASDLVTAITTGTNKAVFRMSRAMTLTGVRASVATAATGSTILIDVNENGTSILGSKLMIDASEKTSLTAATAATIIDSSLANDSEITIDFDQVGSSTAGLGVVVTLIGDVSPSITPTSPYQDFYTLWIDAADSSRFLLSGTIIVGVKDKSAVGRVFAPAMAGPTYTGTGINGRQTLVFTGSNALASSAWNTGNGAFTMTWVGKQTATGTGQVDIAWGADAANQVVLFLQTAGPRQSFSRESNVGIVSSGTVAINTSHVYTINYDRAFWRFYTDGVVTGSAAMTNLAINASSMTIGAYLTNTSPATIEIGEIIGLPISLSATNQATLEQSLKTKWGTP